MKNFSTVTPLTWKGNFLVALIKFLLFFVSLIKYRSWKYPIKDFEENPRHFTLMDTIYLAYKYYYAGIVEADKDSGIKEYFHNQNFMSVKGSSTLTISLGGDLMPYGYINKRTCSNLWNEVGEFFFSSDIVFANLETPIDTSRKSSLVPEVMLNDMLFNASQEIFSVFNGNGQYKGFDVVSVANNHSLDQGQEGLQQTLRFLENNNILYCGAVQSMCALHDIPIINKNGISVAFIAFTFSLNKFCLSEDDNWMCNHIRLNKEDVDISLIVEQVNIARQRGATIIIASLHMGNAYQVYPSKHVMNTIHRICKSTGIDVIVAGHPHNPQPIEWFEYIDQYSTKKKSLIFYSLGDFVSYDIYSWAHLSLMIKLNVTSIEEIVTVSGFEVLPTYMLAEFNKANITHLKFKHFENAYANRASYRKYIQNDLDAINYFYKELLFTPSQRDRLIVKH